MNLGTLCQNWWYILWWLTKHNDPKIFTPHPQFPLPLWFLSFVLFHMIPGILFLFYCKSFWCLAQCFQIYRSLRPPIGWGIIQTKCKWLLTLIHFPSIFVWMYVVLGEGCENLNMFLILVEFLAQRWVISRTQQEESIWGWRDTSLIHKNALYCPRAILTEGCGLTRILGVLANFLTWFFPQKVVAIAVIVSVEKLLTFEKF